MPKDALGHGSNERGGPVATHAANIHALPGKGANGGVMSDRMWHDTMPIENYTGQVQDLLGLWDGSQKPAAITDGERQQINAAYAQRGDWRALAGKIHDQRGGTK